MTLVQVLGIGLGLMSCLLGAPAAASERTTSPDGRYAVSVADGEMFIERLRTHTRLRVGAGLHAPCCELVKALPSEAWNSEVELHDGAFWTKRGVAWTQGRRFLLVRMGDDTLWFLSMSGQLRGDV